MASGSPQPVQSTQTQKSEPWGVQAPHLTKVMSEAERIYNQGPNTMYPGSFTAPTDPATTSGLNRAEAVANNNPITGAATNEATKVLGGDYLNGDNPYLSGMISRTAADVLPRVNASFGNSGGPGGLATRAATLALADSANTLRFNNYNAERDRMTGAMNNAPTLAGIPYIDPQMLGSVGATREAIAQKGIDENIARYDFNQNADTDALARYRAMVEGNYGGTTTGTSTQYLPPQNIFSQVLGGLMGGVGTLGQTGAFGKTGWMFSDIRLKEDIKRVGETDDGLPIYTYSYKAGGPPMMGVMAQDVAKVRPEAVARDPSGYLAVNYGAL